MKADRRIALTLFSCAAIIFVAGCGGGSSSKQISITLTTPDGVLSVDQSEPNATPPFFPTLNFTAAVGGDAKNQGVNWPTSSSGKNSSASLTGSSCSGWGTGAGECGTVTNTTPFSATYTPPMLPASSSITVTLKVASISESSVTQSANITVVEPPTFTLSDCNPANPPPDTEASPCVLPSGQNGVPYISSGSSQVTISFSGGVSPYNLSISKYSETSATTLPGMCLATTTSTTGTSATIAGTPCSSGTIVFQVTVVDNTNNPSAAAPPTSQWYQITVSPPPPLSLTSASLPAGQVDGPYTAAVTAQGGVPPLTWTLAPANSLPPGIAFNTSTGRFSGTPTAAGLTGSSCSPAVAGKYCFTVQVADSALIMNSSPPPKFLDQVAGPVPLSITIQQPPPLQITTASLPDGTTATGYTATLNASGGIAPYTWSITQGQLPAGLTLKTNNDSTGTVSGSPVLAGTSNVTIAVTDSEVPAVTKTAPYGITIAPNGNTTCKSSTDSSVNDALLQGPYAFLFKGFDKDGVAILAGQLTANGQGIITAGSLDANRISGIVVGAAITSGSYCIGSDGRGKMEVTAAFASQATLTEDYDFVLRSDGSAYFFQDNSTKTSTDGNFHTHGEGTLKPQLGAGFSATDFAGHYAFLFSGPDKSAKPAALGGVLVANGSSETLLPGTGDFNDAGTLGSGGSLTGTFGGISGGQGSASLTFPVPGGQTTLNFVFVFVSPSDLYFVECDSSATKTGVCAPGSPNPNAPRLGGEMMLQNPLTTFTSTSLQGTNIASGIALAASGNSDVFVGLLTATTCDGSAAVNVSYDENSSGTVSSPSFSGTCTMGTGLNGEGRAVFAGLGSSTAQAHLGTAYLTDSGTGFLMGSDSAVTTGLLEKQSGNPFSNPSVSGSYALGTPFVVEGNMKNVIGQVASDGIGDLSGVVDEIDPPATSAPNLGQTLSAGITALAANGRGTLVTNGTAPIGFPVNSVLYVVSPSSIRLVSTDTSDQHPNLYLLDH